MSSVLVLNAFMQPLQPTAGARDGAASRFGACYDANYRSVHRFVARMMGSADEADDLAQETFARLWREMERGAEPNEIRAWLYRVASNLVVSRRRSFLRARTLRNAVEESVRDWHARASTDMERISVYRELVPSVLNQLPQPMRLTLVLYHEGLTGVEIAQVLGVKASYVGTLVLRAHERFRREYERMGHQHGMHR